MIIDFLINLFVTVVNSITSVLPTASFSTDIQDKLTTFFGSMYNYNSIFPINEMFIVLGMTLALFGFIFAWSGIKYVIHLIRGN